ncbi:MAG: class I SAM-dependent methyltransferase [Gammaproteobacteria bacterium]|nr:class I SAM-dependent methyltransferase [Gammaproteobacteria bacterium]
MNEELRSRWDERYRESGGGHDPAAVLGQYAHLLPATGMALDLACGLGANALLLASRGLRTWAWDISPVAVERLKAAARRAGATIQAEVRDVVTQPPHPGSFDVIVVSRFLERSLSASLQAALRPGGLLFYQTFTRSRVTDSGPRNNAYRLEDNELLSLFGGLKLRAYREEALLGDTRQGFRNEALMVAQKV